MTTVSGHTADLFGSDEPDGFRYQPGFITPAEEAELLRAIAAITFADFSMRGVVARRRVAFFGEAYDRAAAPLIPSFLLPLRASLARWAAVAPGDFAMALVNEYPPGAPIGWHRDAPQYGIVAGVSLLSECRMRFRPYIPPQRAGEQTRRTTHEITLERRSAYLLTGSARSGYEHHIPPVAARRYSITFRTLRSSAARS
jgi:alkylated DNA repair dioxygenase AlkB